MKKIVSLLFLGLLSISILSPSVVKAAEDQNITESSSSFYSQSVGISPLATPYTTQITLENGESFEITKKYAFILYDGQSARTDFSVTTKNPESYYISASIPYVDEPYNCRENFTYNDRNFVDFELPGERYVPIMHDVTYKVTNYSPGTVIYYLTIEFYIYNLA